ASRTTRCPDGSGASCNSARVCGARLLQVELTTTNRPGREIRVQADKMEAGNRPKHHPAGAHFRESGPSTASVGYKSRWAQGCSFPGSSYLTLARLFNCHSGLCWTA